MRPSSSRVCVEDWGETNAGRMTLLDMDIVRSATRAVVAVTALVLVLSGCTPEPLPVQAQALAETAEPVEGWSQADDFPLTPRANATVVWSEEEVFVVGGDSGPPCPPTADCMTGPLERDGAAFDPVQGTWREIADSPIDIPWSSAVFAGGQLFIYVIDSDFEPGGEYEMTLLSYDVHADGWTMRDTPDDVPRRLVADGDRIILVSGSDELGQAPDLVLETASGGWSELPPDPLGRPSFDRTISVTPAGLILTAKELVASPGAEAPPLTLAARYDAQTRKWSRLPDIEQLGGWEWMWTGTRLVDPQLGSARGDNWGREYPYGGTLAVPDGTWAPLSDPPAQSQHPSITSVPASGRFAASAGYIYDDMRMTWTALGWPHGAPQEPGSAVWAGDQLVVLGGVDWIGPLEGSINQTTWVYSPAQ